MKEKTLLDMKKKVDALSNVMQHVYTEAIETLKTNIKENAKKENEGKAKAETETETETKLLEL